MLSGSIERSVRYVKDRQDRWLYQKRETDVAFVANKGYMHGFIFTDNRIVHGAESGRFKREWPEGGTISSLVLFIVSWDRHPSPGLWQSLCSFETSLL